MVTRTVKRGLDIREIEVTVAPSFLDYKIIIIPRSQRSFFPGYKKDFILKTNLREYLAHMTSAEGDIKIGDPSAGSYICGRLGTWFEHNRVDIGDTLRVSELEHHRIYRLRLMR